MKQTLRSLLAALFVLASTACAFSQSQPGTSPWSVPKGGSGRSTFTNHCVILGAGTAGFGCLNGSAGNSSLPLISQGSGADPIYTQLGNAGLVNSSITIGSTVIALGASSTSLAGMTLVTYLNAAAPSTPASGNVAIWTDSTDKRLHDKNDAGTIGTTVVADTGAANNFLTAISAAGAISKARPACASLSDASVFCNGTNAANLTGTLAFANMATIPADNVYGNPTGSTAVPQALPLVNCANALTYNNTTHAFGCNATAGTGTVTSAQLSAGAGINIATTSGANPCVATCNLTISVNQTVVTNSLGSNTTIANGSYTDGPSTAQGTSGGWWASGTVTIGDTVANVGGCKLWDGTTVIASTNFRQQSTAAAGIPVSLSGFISSPAGNIRISCTSNDATATFRFNDSGAGKDSTLTVHRIQ